MKALSVLSAAVHQTHSTQVLQADQTPCYRVWCPAGCQELNSATQSKLHDVCLAVS